MIFLLLAPTATLVGCVAFVAALCAAWSWSAVRRRRRAAALTQYLSPQHAGMLPARFADAVLQPGSREETITVLCSEVIDLTDTGTAMDSSAREQLLAGFTEGALPSALHPTGSTVVERSAGRIVAFWNAPEPQANHVARGCAAALRLRAHASRTVPEHTHKCVIGLHSGVAQVGNFGSAEQPQYGAKGEAVETALKLQRLSKVLGTDILLSSGTRRAVGTKFVTRRLGEFELVPGTAATIYELIGAAGAAGADDPTRPMRDEFTNALQLFQTRDFQEAETAFARMMEQWPDDGPTNFYFKETQRLRANPPDSHWEPVIRVREVS